MLDLKLIEKKKNRVIYNYYPENEKIFGTIEIRIDDLEVIQANRSDYDKDTSTYLGHAIYRVSENIKNNEYPETQLVAWY